MSQVKAIVKGDAFLISSRHDGGKGVGGRRRWTGTCTGLEAGPVTAHSAGAGGAWKRRHSELREDQQLW